MIIKCMFKNNSINLFKAIFLFILFLCFSSNSFAQMTMKFEDFSTWIKDKDLAGYKSTDIDMDGEDYQAAFENQGQEITVILSSKRTIPSEKEFMKSFYQITEFEKSGLKMMYCKKNRNSAIYIELPKLNATLNITCVQQAIEQPVFEQMIENLNIPAINK